MSKLQLGAVYHGERRATFTFWAPRLRQAKLHIVSPVSRLIPMLKDAYGYWHATVTDIDPGARYFYQWDDDIERPDPASYSQPQGVHAASQLVDQRFKWTDQHWQALPLPQWVIYELHVGTFTAEGTFAAIIPRLPALQELGINALEIMPIAQFPGERNWGYDGVYPYAVQQSYGGLDDFKRLVDACHAHGLAVILDVVYNHLGPEGNYLWSLGHYFTDRYHTPWGGALNYDGAYSTEVRAYILENARYWFENCHCDALRLDAVDTIYDFTAKHLLAELAETAAACSQYLGRRCYLIAESDLNDPRLIRSPANGGYGLDAQWSDDFHHALHAVLTHENHSYYQDFGAFEQLAQVYKQPFLYSGNYSKYRQRRHGADASDCAAWRFLAYTQNHDQIGNRMSGERLSALLPFPALKLAAAATLLSPYLPMLFMGEEYGETRPFQYFISHSDADLIAAVRAGRQAEFVLHHAPNVAPDPQALSTFENSKLQWSLAHTGIHAQLRSFYQELLRLRRDLPALANLDPHSLNTTIIAPRVLELQRWCNTHRIIVWMNFNPAPSSVIVRLGIGSWHKVLDSTELRWGGTRTDLAECLTTSEELDLQLPAYAVVMYMAKCSGKS